MFLFWYKAISYIVRSPVTFHLLQSGSAVESNYPGMVMPSIWPEGQISSGSRQQYHQQWQLDGLHPPAWVREENNSNFMTPENSLLSFDSSANSGKFKLEWKSFDVFLSVSYYFPALQSFCSRCCFRILFAIPVRRL